MPRPPKPSPSSRTPTRHDHNITPSPAHPESPRTCAVDHQPREIAGNASIDDLSSGRPAGRIRIVQCWPRVFRFPSVDLAALSDCHQPVWLAADGGRIQPPHAARCPTPCCMKEGEKRLVRCSSLESADSGCPSHPLSAVPVRQVAPRANRGPPAILPPMKPGPP